MKDIIGKPNIGGGAGAGMGGAESQSGMMSAPTGAATKGFDITDIKQYFHVVVKRIWLVTLCFIIAVLVTLVTLIRQVPVYSSQATVQVSAGVPMPNTFGRSSMVDSTGTDYYAVQERIIKSRRIISRAQERISRPIAEIRANLRGVNVRPEKRTGLIKIAVTSLDPVLSADLANAMAEEYMEFKSEQRIDRSQATVISLTQQANRIREELRKEEDKKLAFERENNVIALKGQQGQAQRFLSQLNSKESEMRMERLLLEAQTPNLMDASDDVIMDVLGGNFGANQFSGPMGSSVTNPVSGQLIVSGPESLVERNVIKRSGWQFTKKRKAELEAQLTDMRTKFRDEHPYIVQQEQELEKINKKIELDIQFALQQYNSKLESLIIRENAVKMAASQWEDEAVKSARKYHEHGLLDRNVKRLQSLYDLVFNRLKEIDISIGIETETIDWLEQATPASSPVSNRKVSTIFLAGAIGIAIGIGLVFGLEYIDDSIRYPEEAQEILGLTFYGVIPSANWDPDDLNSHMLSNIDQKSGLAEAYRNVRSSLIFSGVLKPGVTIALTSAVPREGKTTTTLNISVSLSQAGSRVLLVDADLRRGELHKFFGLEGGRGFSDVLAGNAKPEALIQRTGLPNLDLIATGPFPPNPAELLLTPEFKSFVDYAKRSYDVVLFDCPPVMAVSEAGIMASLADATMFVVWAGQTSRKLSQMSVQSLRQRGANLIGCVLNNLEFGRVGYYYYSTYYGYYDYDYRYESNS